MLLCLCYSRNQFIVLNLGLPSVHTKNYGTCLSLSLSSLMDFPSFSKSQRPHFSISLRRKTAFSEFQASSTVVCFCEILAALRAKQWIRRESWQDSPSSHLTIESSHGFPDQGDAVSLRTVGVCATTCVTAVQFAVWGLPVGWARKGKEREKKKKWDFLDSFFGKPFATSEGHSSNTLGRLPWWRTEVSRNWQRNLLSTSVRVNLGAGPPTPGRCCLL